MLTTILFIYAGATTLFAAFLFFALLDLFKRFDRSEYFSELKDQVIAKLERETRKFHEAQRRMKNTCDVCGYQAKSKRGLNVHKAARVHR